MASASSSLLSQLPAGPAPEGEVSNLVNPTNELLVVSVVTIVLCLALIITTTGIGVFTKYKIMKAWVYEDFIGVIASLGAITYISIITAMTAWGAGNHIWDLSVSSAFNLAYWTMIAELFYCCEIALAKATIVLSLTRIFAPSRKGFYHWSFWTLLVITVLFYGVGFFLVLFQCNPREKTWDSLLPGTCMDQGVLMLTPGAWNVASDLGILILPLVAIWHLSINVKHKIGVSFAFLSTLFALTASCARLYYGTLTAYSSDKTFALQQLGLWTLAEMTTLICCAHMPMFPRFYHWATGQETTTQRASREYRSRASRTTATKSRVLVADDTQELFTLSEAQHSTTFGRNSEVEKQEDYGLRTTAHGI